MLLNSAKVYQVHFINFFGSKKDLIEIKYVFEEKIFLGSNFFFESKFFKGLKWAQIGIIVGSKWGYIRIKLCLWYNCFESNLMRSLLEKPRVFFRPSNLEGKRKLLLPFSRKHGCTMSHCVHNRSHEFENHICLNICDYDFAAFWVKCSENLCIHWNKLNSATSSGKVNSLCTKLQFDKFSSGDHYYSF